MFSYYGIKQNVICSGKWAFATPRNGICPTKWGLAHRGKPFARQNGASRIAERHLPDKTGPRDLAERHLPDKTGPRDLAERQALAHLLYFAIRITGLSSSSRLEAISFNGPRSLPSFSASTRSGA